jgi:hypothetical protein
VRHAAFDIRIFESADGLDLSCCDPGLEVGTTYGTVARSSEGDELTAADCVSYDPNRRCGKTCRIPDRNQSVASHWAVQIARHLAGQPPESFRGFSQSVQSGRFHRVTSRVGDAEPRVRFTVAKDGNRRAASGGAGWAEKPRRTPGLKGH